MFDITFDSKPHTTPNKTSRNTSNFRDFSKHLLGKILSKLFLVISVNYCWRHHFLTKVILVKLKILYIFMPWSKWFTFWNIFLYCKIIISFLKLFSTTCFLCTFQTHLTIKNKSIPKKLKKPLSWWRDQMMIKVTFVNFLSRHIPYCQYSICTKFHIK